ncbi:MAG TPA: prolipoprotein diacylglyceryl transferase [Armatimonadota bacterium]|jgi:phosphatidylglycerol:prolipoprotein diacylglycerol transferase
MLPILFHWGPITLYTYGFLLVLGFLAAVGWTQRHARREGISPEQITDAGLWMLLVGVVCARLVFVALEHDHYTSWTQIFQVWQGGLSLHGGLLGGVLAGAWYCRSQGIPFLKMADVVAPSLGLGYAFGRMGCLLNGCCYGTECHLPWAMRFPSVQVPGTLTPPSHPTQIYSALAGLLIWVLVERLSRRPHYRGQLFGTFLLLYSVYRFLVEALRKGVTARVLVDGLTEGQVASLVMFVVALGLMAWWRRRSGAQELPAAAKAASGTRV